MNSSANRTQQAYYFSIDYWLSLIGSFPINDYLYTYLITILSLVAFVLNSTSLKILTCRALSTSNDFYKLMRIYMLNSIILAVVLATTFLTVSYRFINIINSYTNTFYNVYVYTPLLSTLYLNASLLEIWMLIERMSFFLPSRNKIVKKIGVIKLCAGLLILSAFISSFNYILYTPGSIEAAIDENTVYRIYFMNLAPISLTNGGKLLAFAMYFTRDIVTMLVKLVLNGVLIILVRKYLSKLKKEKLTVSERITSDTDVHFTSAEHKKDTYITKTERNQTFAAILMCAFSLFEHAFYIPSFVLYGMGLNNLAAVFYFMVLVSLAFKQVANFFVFYKLNSTFRCELRRIFVKNLKCIKFASNIDN